MNTYKCNNKTFNPVWFLLKQIENGGGKLHGNKGKEKHFNDHLEEIILFPDTGYDAGNDEYRNINRLYSKNHRDNQLLQRYPLWYYKSAQWR